MSELEIIESIKRSITVTSQISVPIGDDCAEVSIGADKLLVTQDMLLDGSHFDSKKHTFKQIINKLFAVNCSDIYAMGGIPSFASIALALPKSGVDKENLAKAIKAASEKYQVDISGGDTNSWDGPLAITMTLCGHAIKRAITRSGAKEGDAIYVTGPLGGSLVNDRHLNPPNKLTTLRKLIDTLNITSMIDISDGLATDLRHILKASHVGAILYEKNIPIHEDSEGITSSLCDGEDFELCFTSSCLDTKQPNFKDNLKDLGIVYIGKITDKPNIFELDSEGKIKAFNLKGYEH